MRLRRTAIAVIALATTAAAGCASTDGPTDPAGTPTPPGTDSTSPSAPSPGEPSPAPPGQTQSQQGTIIEIAIGGERLQATLYDSATSRDLIDRLPVTLEMNDHGSVEKTGRLPSPLSTAGQPPAADPDIADIGYYAPGNDLVLYYGDQSSYPGIVVIGRMDQTTAERIAAMDGTITATVALQRP
jgi:hypothetical protein